MTGSLAVCSMQEVFSHIQGGRIDVGFLQGAQIDRRGNLNTTVIGGAHAGSGDARWRLGMPGGGPSLVVTDLGCYGFVDGEMTLVSLHPGVTLEQVRAAIGWELRVALDLATTEPPGEDELRVLRELDRNRLYLG